MKIDMELLKKIRDESTSVVTARGCPFTTKEIDDAVDQIIAEKDSIAVKTLLFAQLFGFNVPDEPTEMDNRQIRNFIRRLHRRTLKYNINPGKEWTRIYKLSKEQSEEKAKVLEAQTERLASLRDRI